MTPPSASVTAAGAADLPLVLPLLRQHITFERSAVTADSDWVDRMARLVAAGRVQIFLARSHGEAVGYASVTTDVATWTGDVFAHLDCIYVAQEHRGTGIGRLLMTAVVDAARHRGLRELQWQTPDWNTEAIRFYERLGAGHRPKERFTLALT